MGVQPEVVVTRAPGRGDRVRLLDHERVEASPADRPGRRQTSRARADDHDMLIHRASYRRGHGECYQVGRLTMPVVTIAEVLGGTGVTDAAGVRVRPLAAEDLDEADRICRVAFGTFVGVPQPESFFGDADHRPDPLAGGPGRRAGRGGRRPPGRIELRRELGERRLLRPADASPPNTGTGPSRSACSTRPWTCSKRGGPATPGCSPSRRAPSTWACTRSTGSGRASSPPS